MFFIILTVLLTCVVDTSWSSMIEKAFISCNLVPDIISTVPKEVVSVTYGDMHIHPCDEVPFSDLPNIGDPTLGWPFRPNKFYTMIMADADARSDDHETAKPSYLMWLVVNIQGNGINFAHALAPKTHAAILKTHRIYFLVYEHDHVVEFQDEFRDVTDRFGFSPDEFAERNDLGSPYAGNFFRYSEEIAFE